jgi:hypothetical protein
MSTTKSYPTARSLAAKRAEFANGVNRHGDRQSSRTNSITLLIAELWRSNSAIGGVASQSNRAVG